MRGTATVRRQQAAARAAGARHTMSHEASRPTRQGRGKKGHTPTGPARRRLEGSQTGGARGEGQKGGAIPHLAVRHQGDGGGLAARVGQLDKPRALRLHAVEEGGLGADAQPLLDLQEAREQTHEWPGQRWRSAQGRWRAVAEGDLGGAHAQPLLGLRTSTAATGAAKRLTNVQDTHPSRAEWRCKCRQQGRASQCPTARVSKVFGFECSAHRGLGQ